MPSLSKVFKRHPVLSFFVLAFGISWIMWLPAILAHWQSQMTLTDATPWLTLGSFGPALAALLLTAAAEGRAGVGAWLKGLLPRPIGFGWYLAVLYGPLALGLSIIALLGVTSPQAVLARLPAALVNVPVYALTIFLILGPLGEEPGWRGYALPRLQTRYGDWAASVILGILWALWHWPLSFFAGWRDDISIGAFLIVYPLYVVPLTVIFGWVYNHTRGSVFATTVLHAAFNYTIYTLSQTFDLARYDPLAVRWVTTGLFWLVAIAFSLYKRHR